MTVISVPARLKWAAFFLFWSIPLAAAEVLTISRNAFGSLNAPVAFAAGSSVLLAFGLLRARAWALPATAAILLVWCVCSAWMAVRMRIPALGFFTIFLSVGAGTLFASCKRELGRSFFDPMLSWFEGGPRAIPGVSCGVKAADFESDCLVCRVDGEGVFLFAPANGLLPKLPGAKAELEFRFRERQVRCTGRMMRIFARGVRGAGFQFRELTPDTRKELGDFIEILRGEGYVE